MDYESVLNNNNDARKTCRTCVGVQESKNELISIFTEDQTMPSKKMKFSEMLAAIANHPVHETDALPKKICVVCSCSIRSAYFFKCQAENSYIKLLTELTPCLDAQRVSIKQEKADSHTLDEIEHHAENVPMILEPRTLDPDATFSEDLLIELEPPRIQEPVLYVQDNEQTDEDEIIDYEPDFTDHDEPEQSPEEQPSIAANDKSPDSGFPSPPMPTTSNKEKSESPSSNLLCNICNKHMFSVKAMLRHKRNHHSVNRCNFCKRRFGSKMHLKQHVRIRHPQKYNEFRLNGQTEAVVQVEPVTEIPECEGCQTKFCNKEALQKHSADCDLKCSECGLILHYKESYLLHLAKEHNIVIEQQQSFECPFGCTVKFKTDKVLQEHIETTHPDPTDNESWVDAFSEGEDSVQSGPFTVHSCQTCDAVFKSHNSLTQHQCKNKKKITVPDKPKTRNVPKYTRDEFIEKFMVHKTQDATRCLACNFDVGRRNVFNHLKNKHASVKTYRCEVCTEAFFRSDYRTRHMQATHPTSYRCQNCNVQFDRIYKYDAHMKIHGVKAKNFKPLEGQDRYDLGSDTMKFIEDMSTFDYSSCPIQRRLSVACAPAANSRAEVPMPKEEFVKKYLKQMPDGKHQCTVCQQDMQYSSIHSHILWRHAVQKPFKCAFCNERSVKQLGRLSHMNRCHPSEYRCHICHVQSSQHANYVNHMWENHRETVNSLPSLGEEPDLKIDCIRFTAHKSEEEVIPEPEEIFIEDVPKSRATIKPVPASLQMYKDDNRELTFEEFRLNFLEDNDSDYKCLVCDRTLRKRNIGSHVKSRHATTGAFKCAVCPEAFFRPEHRIQHMAERHRGMFHCQACNIQFYRNSRYALHLKQQHDIEVDDTDQYEVDLNLNQVMYVAKIIRGGDDSTVPSIVHDPEPEPEEQYEAAYESVPTEGGLIRSMFLAKYFRSTGKDSRRCEPCNKVVPNGSVHHHLMHEHALMQPYKCPFCDLRLDFASLRVRHMQIFHPNEYKCHECALQFQNYSKFSDHMLVEHGHTETSGKSPLEVPDISTNEIKYAAYKHAEDDIWQDESSSSTVLSTSVNAPIKNGPSTSKKTHNDVFLRPQVKVEPRLDEIIMHSIFGNDDSPLFGDPDDEEGLSYNEFIAQHTIELDNGHITCKPCDKTFLRTSISQHMRNKHTTSDGYKCELCSAGFLIGELRRKHMLEVHPNDYLCTKCPIQFYYSITYKKHMKEAHKTNINVHILKLADEVDIPLDRLRFAEMPKRVIVKQPRSSANNTLESSFNGNGSSEASETLQLLSYADFVAQHINDKDDKSFRCMACHKTIVKTFFKTHLVRYHSIGKHYGCQLCNETFKKKPTRMRHMLHKHENDFKCYDCVVQFDTATAYKEHMKSSHNKIVAVRVVKLESEMDVPLEDMFYSPAVTVVSGATKFNIPKNTFDEIPDDIVLNRDQLYGKFYRSIKKKTNDIGISKTKCLACNKIFSSQNRSLHAFYNHATSRPFKCELCPNKGFFAKMKRTTHMKFAHPNEYNCKQCNKQFDRAKIYATHMKQHSVTVVVPKFNDDEINVPVEKIGYMKNKELAKVMLKGKIVRDKTPTVKAARDKTAVDNPDTLSDVQQYFAAVSNQSSKCGICNREFPTSRALRIHLRNHTDGDFQQESRSTELARVAQAPVVPAPVEVIEKKEECDVCGNKFATPFALNAHKKMKHDAVWKKRRSSIYSPSGRFFEFFCDICDFTSSRRDYLDRHVGSMHTPEFRCQFCNKQMSNYNYYSFHLHDYHPAVADNAQLNSFKCKDCYKCFSTAENRESHMKTMHRADKAFPKHYCSVCCVSLGDSNGLDCHNVLKSHKQHLKFLSAKTLFTESSAENNKIPLSSPVKPKFPALKPIERPSRIKIEPSETAVIKTRARSRSKVATMAGFSSPEPNCSDPMLAMMSKTVLVTKAESPDEPARKRTRLSSSLAESSRSLDDKKTYELHLETHIADTSQQEVIDIVDEHPKLQVSPPPTQENKIECKICQQAFRLTIMLNRHNLQWHNESNADRELSVNDQKLKKESQKMEPTVIKVFKCKFCSEAFIRAADLETHMSEKHTPVQDEVEDVEAEQETAGDSSKTGSFTCDKCNFVFHEQKFLENHQQFFCAHRAMKNGQAMNEQ